MYDGGIELTEILRRLEHCDDCEQATNILHEAFESPSIFVFGELFGAPIIRALAEDPSFVTYYRTLCLFATGKWSDYEAEKSLYIPLSGSLITKLRQLTILSLVQSNRVLSYARMISALGLEREDVNADGISTVRLLEDLIIDGISHQLFDGRLDGQTENFYADRVSARDVPRPLGHFNGEESLISLSGALNRWSERAQEAAQMLDQHIHLLREENTARQQSQTANHDAMVRALTQARSSPDARISSQLKEAGGKPSSSAKYVL
ncbi:hypothetical protein MPSI1_002886 [Malassezia psittaci]|uniref:PCI domain-containing protein n=1 Tax=Malassezia psittaci TaxID=1821823 RepID=A0AAF0JF34_9BASI|nr:hypothetical protein MPSI1_002886 [Malassezia psittaci]